MIRLYLSLLFTFNVFASNNYTTDKRIGYIEDSLKSIIKSSKKEVNNAKNYIDLLHGGTCSSSSTSLTLDCLMELSNNNCRDKKKSKRPACRMYSDIIITNKMSESYFISGSEKYKMMKKSSSYEEALGIRRNQIHAFLSTQFFLSKSYRCDKKFDYNCFAQSIDTFCMEHSNEESISWHHCIASLTWFIGKNSQGMKL